MKKLDRLFEVSLLDQYAKEYALDPDVVYHKEMNTLLVFADLWGERARYFDRFRAAEKFLSDAAKQ